MSFKKIFFRRQYSISSVDDIQNIPDIVTAKRFLKKWKVKGKVKTRDEAVTKLLEAWQLRSGKLKDKHHQSTAHTTEGIVGSISVSTSSENKTPTDRAKCGFKGRQSDSRSSIDQIRIDIHETTSVLKNTVAVLDNLDEKLPLLNEKAKQLKRQSSQFKKITKMTRLRHWCRSPACFIYGITCFLFTLSVTVFIIIYLYLRFTRNNTKTFVLDIIGNAY